MAKPTGRGGTSGGTMAMIKPHCKFFKFLEGYGDLAEPWKRCDWTPIFSHLKGLTLAVVFAVLLHRRQCTGSQKKEGTYVKSSLLPKFALLFCSCPQCWVSRRGGDDLNVVLFEFLEDGCLTCPLSRVFFLCVLPRLPDSDKKVSFFFRDGLKKWTQGDFCAVL